VEYFKLANMSIEKFTALLDPLRSRLVNIGTAPDGHIPFVIVIKGSVVPPEKVMPMVVINKVQGEVRMTPFTSEDFSVIDKLAIPKSQAYLLVDIDSGQKTLNVTPHNALAMIDNEKRHPLTIDEGIALLLHFPEILTDKKKYNCFSTLGSRRNDQRVPAFWISYKKPRLGWCWDNNPHTWLGCASCKDRIGA